MSLPFETYFEAMAKEYERIKLLPNIRAFDGFEESPSAVFDERDRVLLKEGFVFAFNVEVIAKSLFARSSIPARQNVYFSIINCAYRCKNLFNEAHASILGNGVEQPLPFTVRGNFNNLFSMIKGQVYSMLTVYDKLLVQNSAATRRYLSEIELAGLRVLIYFC